MTGLKKKAAEQLITVDARKLGQGLKTTFEGVALVFDSLGVDAGFDIEEKKSTKAKPAQEVKDEAEDAVIDATADTAGEGDTSSDDSASSDTSENEVVEEPAEEKSRAEEEKVKEPEKTETAKTAAVPTISLDDVTKIIVQKIKQNRSNNEKIGQILKTYGVAKVGELDPSKYEAFLTDLSEL